MRSLWCSVIGVGVLACAPAVFAHGEVDHGAWNRLLQRYVSDGRVDYRGLAAERHALEAYLDTLREAHMEHLPSVAHQAAFWINAYNACVVRGVLDRYPLRSVKEAPGFFERITCRVAGESLTLNAIEARGRQLGDWRIHFALVCASSSCPPLMKEAYIPGRLNEQLAEQTRQFLADPQRGLRVEDRMLWLSKIFDWYKTDFIPASEMGWRGRLTPEKLLPRIEPYLDRRIAQAIRSQRLSISFLDYDWSLNAQHK